MFWSFIHVCILQVLHSVAKASSKKYSEKEKHHGTFYKTVHQKLPKVGQGGLFSGDTIPGNPSR